MKKFMKDLKKKATEAKKKAMKLWEDNKGTIILILGTTATVTATAISCKAIKKWGEEWNEHNGRDAYVPHRLFDKNGKEFRLFAWDSGWQGDPDDLMYFPSNEIGWSDEIDWDSL